MSTNRIIELATLIRALKREVVDLEPRLVAVKKQLEDSEAELLELQPARQPKPDVEVQEATGAHGGVAGIGVTIPSSTLTPPAGETLEPAPPSSADMAANAPASTIGYPDVQQVLDEASATGDTVTVHSDGSASTGANAASHDEAQS